MGRIDRMSTISILVSKMRFQAESYKELLNHTSDKAITKIFSETSNILTEAADTIESISAKLADMERPEEDCGGWIYCGDGKNLPEEEKEVFIQVRGRHVNANITDAFDFATYSNEKGWDLGSYPEWDSLEVLAWRELPEPYRGAKGIENNGNVS